MNSWIKTGTQFELSFIHLDAGGDLLILDGRDIQL